MTKCRADSEIVLSSEPQDHVSGNIRILVCCYEDFVILKGELRATLKMKCIFTTSQPIYTKFGINGASSKELDLIFYKVTLFCIKDYQLLNTFNGCLIIKFWPTDFCNEILI